MGCLHAQAGGVATLVASMAVAGLLTGCTRGLNPVTGERQFYAYSWEQEQQLGEQAHTQISTQLGLYEDEALQSYVAGIGQQVLASSELREADMPAEFRSAEFTFRVMDSPTVNAFALPGGYVYVTRGLLAHLQNEAQLAVVLGHEVGHVVARHASRQALRARTAQLGLFAGAIIGSEVIESPALTRGLLQLGSQATQLLLLKYGRDAERESDRLGVKYALAQGYEASEGAAFFHTLERISAKSGDILPTWQSTHPDPGVRREDIHALADTMRDQPRATYRVNREAYFKSIAGMIYGSDPAEGFVEGNQFFHPKLRFQFVVPADWQVQNERGMVLLLAPGNQASLVLEVVQAESAEAAAQRVANNGQLQAVEGRNVQINGLPAYQLRARAGEKQVVDLLLTFIEYQDQVYAFTAAATPRHFVQYRDSFTEVTGSFAPLTNPDKLNVQPIRLQIVTAARQAPLRELLPEELPPPVTPEEVAILNQLALDDVVSAGRPLKIPHRATQP